MFRSLSLVLITLLLTGACASALETPVPTSPPQETKENDQLAEYLTRLSKLDFSGSVLIAHHGQIILSHGYGMLDNGGTKLITPDTPFAIGSNTKPFTAAAVLKLQDQGLLRVQESISQFFPDAPADKAIITVHQLLTHSSGLDHSGLFQGDFEQVDREAAVARILQSDLLFKPGTESSYSDYGFILLAAIIERVSGKTYQEYVRTELLEPAEMSLTGWWGEDPNLAGQPSAGNFSNLPGPYWSIMGAGGMVSSVGDLYRWHTALQQGKILSKETLDAYSRVQFRVDKRGGEGYGWVVLDEPGKRMRAHAGGTPQLGHNNAMRWYIDEDLLIIASSVGEELKAEDVVPNLARIVLGLPYSMPPETVTIAGSKLDHYVGRYQLDSENILIVTRDGNRLLFTAEGSKAFDLLFKGEGQDTQAAQSAVVEYLSKRKDVQLEQWKKRISQRLGQFKEFKVFGTAPMLGNGEPWTYVSFVFERGSILTRWIVSPAGALEAAVLDSKPPYRIFLPQSEERFAPFSLSVAPAIQEVSFITAQAGNIEMTITTSTSRLHAVRLFPAS